MGDIISDNIHYLPTYEPPEPQTEAREPLVIRNHIDAPELAPAPTVTPLGLVVAVLCAFGSFAFVTALVG